MSNVPLVYWHGRHVVVGAATTGIMWVGDTAVAALGDGTVRNIGVAGDLETIAVHHGAILCACRHPDGASIITGGDDGRVRRVAADGITDLGRFGSKWVEHLVASPASGLIVAGVAREAVVWTRDAAEPSHRFEVGSTIGGLALDGKGRRLGVSHYNGATLFYASSAASGRIALNWVGSHLACTIRSDGDYFVTALQETGLHAWKLPGTSDMRMSGYTAKTRSFAWSRRGKWLATGGDDQAILWPFEGKTGPMGKTPAMLGKRQGAVVSRVAFHPRIDLLAIGYSDGAVALGQLENGDMLPIDEPAAAITALTWNDTGTLLAWGDEDGRVGLLDMKARA